MIDVVMSIAGSFGHFVGWVVILVVLDHTIRFIKLRKMVKKLEGSDFKKKNEMQGSGEMTEFHGTRFAVCEVVSTVCVGEVSWEKA